MSVRSAVIPFDHIAAELAAFPLASAAALSLSPTALDPRMGHGTAKLWREAERAVITQAPSFSVDELTSLRDWLWFDGEPDAQRLVPLTRYLRRLSRHTLEAHGYALVPRAPPWGTRQSARNDAGTGDAQGALARRSFRWMSFAMPPDLLIAASNNDALAGSVEILSRAVQKLLSDDGYVESHLHFRGAVDFPLLWISTLHALARQELKAGDFRSPGAELSEGAELGGWLLRAAIARYVLAEYLTSGSALPFADYLFGPYTDRMADSTLSRRVRSALIDLVKGYVAEDGPPFAALRDAYAKLTKVNVRWRHFPDRLGEAYQADPIRDCFPALGNGRLGSEMRLTAAALAHIEGRAANLDGPFERLFWQVVRVRGLFYRHVVQRPLTPGLQWFTRFYARLRPGRSPMSTPLLVESAYRLCRISASHAGSGLRSLELRTSPEADNTATLQILKDVAARLRDVAPGDQGEGEQAKVPVEHGLVLHFARLRGGGAAGGAPNAKGLQSHADPTFRRNDGYRYGSFYRKLRAEALSAGWVLSTYPLSVQLVRGVDVCTDELGVPTWVMAPLCRYVRDIGRYASETLQRDRGLQVPPLAATAHAGEDFVHLLGGLRRVDEALEHLHLDHGDRLGHGIALGIDPVRWAEAAGGVAVTREERLLDLAWEWDFYREHPAGQSGERVHYLLNRIAELSEEIFRESCDPHTICELIRRLHSEDALRAAGFPGPARDAMPPAAGSPSPPGRADSTSERANLLLARYLTDGGVFQRGQALLFEDPAFEAAALASLQRELRRKVGARGVTVEINPSSNLLVGNLGDLTHHPLWRLRPPRRDGDAPPVAVCIGSDNPLAATTRTPEEYQLAYDTLTLAGASHAEAAAWLDETRRAGLAARFTLPSFNPDITSLRRREELDFKRMP